MSEVRFNTEIAQLGRLCQLLASDRRLTLRLELKRQGLTWRKFFLGIHGLSALAVSGEGWTHASNFWVDVTVPPTYPDQPPIFQFQKPTIPFHPHIWVTGAICWGSANRARRDLMLIDWVRDLIDYLQFGQGASMAINRNSPANSKAVAWHDSNKSRIGQFVPRIDMERLRFFVDQARA